MAEKELRSIQFPGLEDRYVVPEGGGGGATGPAGKDGLTPTIGANGNWYLGDIDTQKPSRGEKGDPGAKGADGATGKDGSDGYSPEATVTQINGGAKIIIKDRNGTTSANVMNGAQGPKGDKGDPGAQGPVGPKGAPGKDGADAAADLSLGITGATPGQIAKITAVDTDGKPTAWTPVDMPTGTDLSLGITSAAVGNIIKIKSVDAKGRPTSWEPVQAEYAMLKTRYDTIVDYTFDGTSTLSTAKGLSDYILYNNCKAVWNKDAQGNPLKAVRMWGYIECTKAVTQEAILSSFTLSAACRGSYFYQDTPSSWYYGDDIGNGVGTYELNDEYILNSKSISINKATYGWCDHIARCGAVQSAVNNTTWVGTLNRSFAAARVPNLAQANYYKDYIYAAMLLIGAAKSDYIIPDGVRIVVVAEVIDE